ncbi:SDR family NAD(P)-dependent oxidoreductase [Roseibium alexandrii]|uniref:3-oxoacyl-[acyl-carrier-protein] reductase FabG n=1 Tax=Roseibium alexandrii TaxID=388408 RepID=A0A0M7AA99_9HYPH|nr:SDR family NAD(P)-dependent oxidoreductase [Roseibium alexandrii]CTQ71392.1 3-oxoacyl-[acyl-carrier-protein] reductase FabG [Roseibium alexandrii]
MTTRKIALVTGATRGIGKEAATQLAQKGFTVLVAGRSLEQAAKVAENLKNAGHSAQAVKLDITQSSDIADVVAEIGKTFGKLDILVNNAGVQLEGDWGQNNAASVSQQQLRETFAINLFAQVELTQSFLPLLRKSDDAQILNVSSIVGSLQTHADTSSPWGAVKPFAYNASKAALNLYTISLAQALAGDGIRVASVHPGWVKTDLGTDAAPLTIAEGAQTITELATNQYGQDSGGFYHLGENQPW